MKNKHQFQQAVTTASRVLGGNLGAEVVFSGASAYTDGKTITIPQLPDNALITEKEEAVTTGYYCHESAHIRYTDMKYILQEMTDAENGGDPLLKSLINACEDCFIEREWVGEYEGSINPLSDAHITVDERAMEFMDQADNHSTDWRHIGPMAITWMSGREKDYDGEVREDCISRLGEGMEATVSGWYDKYVKPIRNSRDSVEAARNIAREMHEVEEQKQKEAEQQQQQQQQGDPSKPCDGGDGGEGGEGQAEGQGQDSPDAQGQDPQQGDGGDKSGNGEGQSSEAGDEQTSGEGSSSSSEGGEAGEYRKSGVTPMSVDIDVAKALGVADKMSSMGSGGRKGRYCPFTEKYDEVLDSSGKRPSNRTKYKWDEAFNPRGAAQYDQLVSETAGTISVMRRKIQRAFLAKREREWTGGHTAGRLNPRDLVRAYNGNDDVYRQRSEAPDVDTAVQIVVDASSSMGGGVMTCAAVTAIALCHTLDGIGCETEVITFDGDVGYMPKKEKERMNAEGGYGYRQYSRYYSMCLVAHKSFDEPFKRAKVSLGNMEWMPSGGTPTGDALMVAYPRLLKRNAQRKILLLVTDGAANNLTLAKYAINKIKSLDVEVAGIGIGGNYIGNHCDRSVVVNDVDDLAGKVMDDFAKMLLGERFSVTTTKGVAA